MKSWIMLGLVLSCAAGCGTLGTSSLPAFFPMAKGTCWIYDRHAEVCGRQGGVVTNDATLTCVILETADRPGVAAALFSALPTHTDVWSAEAADGPGLLLRVGASQYHVTNADLRDRLNDPNDGLLDLVTENTLLLDGPLVPGKRFGDLEQIARDDGRYVWRVETEEWVRLRGIRGISPWRKQRIYRMVYDTNPDAQTIVFAPGIGIVEYTYRHHGTPSDITLRLRDFVPPPRATGRASRP